MYVFVLSLLHVVPDQYTKRVSLPESCAEAEDEDEELGSGDDDDDSMCYPESPRSDRVVAVQTPYRSLMACKNSVESVRLFLDVLEYDTCCFAATTSRRCEHKEKQSEIIRRLWVETGQQLYDNVLFFDINFLRAFGYRPKSHPASQKNMGDLVKFKNISFDRSVLVAISERDMYSGHVYLWTADAWYRGAGDDRHLGGGLVESLGCVAAPGTLRSGIQKYLLGNKVIRSEFYAPKTSPYAFMIGIRSSLTNLSLSICSQQEGITKALIRGACAWAFGRHKEFVCVVFPTGKMATILTAWSEDPEYPVTRVPDQSPTYDEICLEFSRILPIRCQNIYLIHARTILDSTFSQTTKVVANSYGLVSN